MKFVQTTNNLEDLSAPYLRANFIVASKDKNHSLKVAVAGLYDLYFNGVKINEGFLSPYRSNADQCIFVDIYNISKYLKEGKNTIAFILGNGFANSLMKVWKFDEGAFNPKIAFELLEDDKVVLDATSLKYHESEIVFNEYHKGEHIDARKLISNWTSIDCDDSNWKKVMPCDSPKGEILNNNYKKILSYETLSPIKIIKGDRGFIYDFGKSVSGFYELEIKGEKGKTIYLFAGDGLEHGKKVFTKNISSWWEEDPKKVGCDWLTLSGNVDIFKPRFTYKGCRFIELSEITDEEAKTVKIKLLAVSSLQERKGYFKCDNEVINKLQECVVNSDLSNFLYFPTDCPHREKNGWTGDANISCEQMLLNFDCASQYKNWLKTICIAQKENGAIPCICPCRENGFGYDWGTGPAWDIIIFESALTCYIYSGDKEVLETVSNSLVPYINYMFTKRDEKGLFHYGLEDWLPVMSHTPVAVTDTIYCYKICSIASKIFNILGDIEKAQYSLNKANEIRDVFRKEFKLDKTSDAYTQTWLSMAISEGLYTKEEAKVFLLHRLSLTNNHIDFGIFGSRYLFRTLSDLGETELAVKLIVQDSYPSYKACFLDAGLTTLSEYFMPEGTNIFDMDNDMINWCSSLNHHMYGDISSFFYRNLAGIRIDDVNTVNFEPCFVDEVNKIEASHIFDAGELKVNIKKSGNDVDVSLDIPKGIKVNLINLNGYKCDKSSLCDGMNKLRYTKL